MLKKKHEELSLTILTCIVPVDCHGRQVIKALHKSCLPEGRNPCFCSEQVEHQSDCQQVMHKCWGEFHPQMVILNQSVTHKSKTPIVPLNCSIVHVNLIVTFFPALGERKSVIKHKGEIQNMIN